MDFYSGKQPNLIGPIMKTTVCKIIKKDVVNNTISDKISKFMSDFYKSYIMDNKLIIFAIIIFIIFLIYRYHNKKPEKRKEKFTEKETTLLKEIEDYQMQCPKYSQIVMNPTMAADEQKDDIHYPADPLPINIPNSGIVYARDIYPKQPPFTQLNNVDYDHNNVYEYPSNSYYDGTYNTYKNAKDTDIINPYSWSNNFNTNTGNFVRPMTNGNNQNMIDYQTIIDNKQGNLIDGLEIGPRWNANKIEPPYVTNV